MNLDPQLLDAAHKGDRKAQYALYRSCFPVLMAVCMRYRRDEQDAVAALNLGFLKIINNIPSYRRDKVPFEAWIRRIMINTAIDEFRKEKKWRELTVFADDLEKAYPEEPIVWTEPEKRLDIQQLEAMVQRLPPITQQVFNLFALDGFSHKEISKMLGMSEGTSKWHVNSARNKLKELIRSAEMNA
ncbi:MAG: RNA polymerase sigma factor [Saprospiraceae bacterium]|nr:RNA polymerase sigma factor [Saprospiraceae bacterium]MCB9344607.1 RNA polymerase sigma factor [Lewinellaceae bacterium]